MKRLVIDGAELLHYEHKKVEIRLMSLPSIHIILWKPGTKPTGRVVDDKIEYYEDACLTIDGVDGLDINYNTVCYIKTAVENAINMLNAEGHNLINKNFTFNSNKVISRKIEISTPKIKIIGDSEINTFTIYENEKGYYLYLGYGYALLDNVKVNRTGAFYCWLGIDKRFNLDYITVTDYALLIRDSTCKDVQLITTTDRLKFTDKVKQLQPYKIIGLLNNELHNIKIMPYNGQNESKY